HPNAALPAEFESGHQVLVHGTTGVKSNLHGVEFANPDLDEGVISDRPKANTLENAELATACYADCDEGFVVNRMAQREGHGFRGCGKLYFGKVLGRHGFSRATTPW